MIGERIMHEVILSISSRKNINDRFLAAWNTGHSQPKHLSFESEELLWKTLTLKRWQILKLMTGAGEMTIREVARRLGRDVKAVHGDVTALLVCGILEKSEDSEVLFPYDAVHVDFMLQAA
jgi:predicted transcriptional regulator